MESYSNDSAGAPVSMQNRKSPIYEHGGVILNGVKARAFMDDLRVKTNPKYKAPRGKYALSNEEVLTGELVWSDTTMDESESYLIHNKDERDPMHISVPGLSSINRIGYSHENRDQILGRIHVWGVATSGTDQSQSENFNIVDGGIITIGNNGSKYITNGMWIMAYLPHPHELGDGGLDNEATAHGRHTLWTMPYDPSQHLATTDSIYHCLTAIDEGRSESGGYQPRYARSCRDFERGVQDLAYVWIKTLLDNDMLLLHPKFQAMMHNQPTWTEENKSAVGYVLTAMMGRDHMSTDNSQMTTPSLHSALKKHVVPNRLPGAVTTAKKLRTDARKNLFPRQSNSSWFVPASKENQTAEDKVVLQVQSEATEIYLSSISQAIKEVSRLVVGKAVTGAAPGTDFDIRLARYAM